MGLEDGLYQNVNAVGEDDGTTDVMSLVQFILLVPQSNSKDN